MTKLEGALCFSIGILTALGLGLASLNANSVWLWMVAAVGLGAAYSFTGRIK